ncbi:MAG: hypothetical protein KDD82_03540, partial [Planctomycetes bacterium]|nr:hypothetical protein [Planctomycetota bacterium]
MRDAAIALGVLILACGCPASKPTKNPLDLWSGRYQSAKLEVELELDGASYTGTVVKQGERYPLTAKPAGTDELEGQFTVGEESFACTLHMTKQGLDFTTGSSTYVLTEVRAPANPLDSGGDPSAPANPLDAGGGSTPDPSPAP